MKLTRILAASILALALGACAGVEWRAPSSRGSTEVSTGSNVPRKTAVSDRDVITGSRDDYERQMDKAHTIPKSRENP